MTSTSSSIKRPLVLAVDDSEDLRDFYEMALASAGFSVVLAADGQQALDLARELRPDVIITDVSMPVMDGLEFLVRMRSDLAPPLPPIIVCSGFDMTESTALRLGAFRFLPKPFESEDLLAMLTLALEGRKPEGDTMAAEKERIRHARERAAKAAAEALRDVDFASPRVKAAVQGFCDWIADYFGFGGVAIAFVEGGNLRTRAASRGSAIPPDTVFDGHALYTSGVLASGASLVIADTSTYSFVNDRVKPYGIRSFVGVPLLGNGVPIGTIVLVDQHPRSFAAEDLLILEEFGRGAIQTESALPAAVERIGLLTPGSFHRVLAAELALHHRHGGSLDVLLVEHAARGRLDAILEALHRTSARSRLGISQYGVNTLAMFVHDPSDGGASRRLSQALASIATVTPLRATGWISLASHLPMTPAQDLVEMAAGALEQAQKKPAGSIERFELRRQPWQGAPISS